MAKYKVENLKAKINKIIEGLETETENAKFSKDFENYLQTVGKFHNYSFLNQFLIGLRNASHVAGFNAWKQKFNRHVKSGEAGIPIFAPILVNRENEDGEKVKRLVGFKIVYVWDISQTDGEEIPELNIWKSKNKNEVLESALRKYAESLGLKIISENTGSAEGYINTKKEIHIKPDAGTKTLAHEIAHYLCGHVSENTPRLSHKIVETQAEASAYAVMYHFGIVAEGSKNYLALTGTNHDDFRNSMQKISKTASKIISGIEENL